MTEKRRGRPPKLIALPVACPECGRVEGHYDDCSLGLGVAAPSMLAGAKDQAAYEAVKAQAYANRVWSGQSPDVKRAERIERVKRALAGQNLPFEGVVLP